MMLDKNEPSEARPQQASQTKEPINPFRDADNTGNEPTVEEESNLEQQRKEALTERD